MLNKTHTKKQRFVMQPKTAIQKSMSLERDSLTTISFFFSCPAKDLLFDWIWFYKTERISLNKQQHNLNENIC